MPLRDHFHSPVNDTHSWDEVHGQWPGEIVRNLKGILPQGYRAGPNIHLASPFEVDVSAYDHDSRESADRIATTGGAVALAPEPTLTIETDISDEDVYEVNVYDTARGRRLVAAIEIVSPANKDRPKTREMFVSKVASLLQNDVCVSIVDLITVRQANLYAELLEFVGGTDPALANTIPHLYAVSLRSRKPLKGRPLLDAWFYPMTIGDTLPTLPIWLEEELRVMLPLETSYEETCSILDIA